MIAGHEGNRPGPAGIDAVKALAGIALVALWAAAAPGASPIGASSSSTVEIRLSVAPRMQLTAVRGSGLAAPAYCLSSNASPAALPVTLVWAETEPSPPKPGNRGQGVEPSAGIELSSCRGDPAFAGPALGRGETREVLIRPE
jgi:hypothetical protein